MDSAGAASGAVETPAESESPDVERLFPHLADAAANARHAGVKRGTLADALERAADRVRAGEFDPDTVTAGGDQ